MSSVIDWLNDNTGAVQAISVAVLALVTAVYAWRTWTISTASDRQAKASVEMTREMREQRLSQDKPILVLDILREKTREAWEWDNQSEQWIDPESGLASRDWRLPPLVIRVYNAGRGAAVQPGVTFFHPPEQYDIRRRGSLLAGEAWEVRLPPTPMSENLKPAPWEIDLREQLGAPTDAWAVALCKDINGKAWASALYVGWKPEGYEIVMGKQTFLAVDNLGERSPLEATAKP